MRNMCGKSLSTEHSNRKELFGEFVGEKFSDDNLNFCDKNLQDPLNITYKPPFSVKKAIRRNIPEKLRMGVGLEADKLIKKEDSLKIRKGSGEKGMVEV